MFREWKTFAALVAIWAVSAVAFAETITVIDDFSDGSARLAGGAGTDEDSGLLSAIGGVRRVEKSGIGGVLVNFDPYLGQAHLAKGFTASNMVLSYGSNTSAGSELNLNWSSGGSLFVDVSELKWSSGSGATFELLVSIESGGTDYEQGYWGLTDGAVEIPLSDFPRLNLWDLDGLKFAFGVMSPNAVLYHYVTIDAIYTDAVAEPSTLLLLGAGALYGLACARQRRHRHQ